MNTSLSAADNESLGAILSTFLLEEAKHLVLQDRIALESPLLDFTLLHVLVNNFTVSYNYPSSSVSRTVKAETKKGKKGTKYKLY